MNIWQTLANILFQFTHLKRTNQFEYFHTSSKAQTSMIIYEKCLTWNWNLNWCEWQNAIEQICAKKKNWTKHEQITFLNRKNIEQLWEISVREKSMFRFDSEICFKGKNPINRFHCIFVVQEILFHCDLRFVDIPNHDFSHLHLCDAMRITRLPNHHKMIFIVRTIEFSMVNAHRTF